jgi:hypothetical protein
MQGGPGAECSIDIVEKKSRGDIGALLLVVPNISAECVAAGVGSARRATARGALQVTADRAASKHIVGSRNRGKAVMRICA